MRPLSQRYRTMSTSSKTRRDQRRRQEKQAANKAAAQASPVKPHAELRDAQRTLLAGVVRRDGEWVLGMDGRIAGHSDSAAQVLALIMQAGELHERNGTPVRTLHPEKRRYLAGGQVMTEAALAPGFTRDLYVALGEPLDDAHEKGPGARCARPFRKIIARRRHRPRARPISCCRNRRCCR